MDRYDVIGLVGDVEGGISDILIAWFDDSPVSHLIKETWDGYTLTLVYPDEANICFCDTCEEAWLKGEDSRCECEKEVDDD